VNHKFDGYHWIYWLGPALGAILAVLFYRFIKLLEYETANPGQDFDEQENEFFQPTSDPASAEEVRRPNVAAAELMSSNSLGAENSRSFSLPLSPPETAATKERGDAIV